MSTRRRAVVDDGAALRPRATGRSITPLSTNRKLPSPSLLKENSNSQRKSSSFASNPKPLPRTRARSSSPSQCSLPRSSLDRTLSKPNPRPTQKPKPSSSTTTATSRSTLDTNPNPNNNKCTSRLHEKLAFLEGKVKRIASDIKKTKEMLDLNNPDASKVILSDIQDKISGIEKAMVQVVPKNDAAEGAGKSKSLVKGLNSEEVEARLFPHQRLLRERTVKDSVAVKVEEEKVLSPPNDNSVAAEFLASLSKETVTAKGNMCVGEEANEAHGGEEVEGNNNNHNDSNIDNNVCDEKLEDFDDRENGEDVFVGDEVDEAFNFRLNEIGSKVASGGWFVTEGEAVLLAHYDGSCSYHDVANSEEKAVYMPPPGVSPNIWRDCWLIRAPGSDGCSGRFVVAASAGNTMDSGFCSWDFYTKEVRALQVETGITSSRTALRPLPNNIVQRRNSTSSTVAAEARQWWYKPCGYLMVSTCSSQRTVKVFDVRDGEKIMKLDVQKPVAAMEFSSPLQWRNRGKIVMAEAESISLWDVNSLQPQALVSVPSGGRKVSGLHVSNTDAELGAGVRKRVSSAEAEGNDGVFCTSDFINVLDFRQPSGVGLRIPKHGVNVQSVFSRGESVFLGCTNSSAIGKKQSLPLIQQFSLRRQGLFGTYVLPESNAHSHHTAISQVWGNSDFVMGVCGLGLFVFNALKDDDSPRVLNADYSRAQSSREVIGPDDLYWPSFDYLGSRALLISRDRPAMWRHLIP